MDISNLGHINLALVQTILHIETPSTPLVAGGFVRDILLKRPPRDADIYIEETKEVREALTGLGLAPSGPLTRYGGKHIKNIYTDGERIEVMIVEGDPKKVIRDSFDYGICMCAMTGTGDVLTTTAFNKDIKDKSITCYIRPSLTHGQIGKSLLMRSQKLRAKFPEYEFKVDVAYETTGTMFDLKPRR